jgi:hypothetical protein
VIHRDLKPANLLIARHGDDEDFVKVLDFGLVKDLEDDEEATQAGVFMGTPKYMSPEQIRGEDVDSRSDIYALGVLMHELLTGSVPFDGDTSVKILMAHMHSAPPVIENPDVPESMRTLITECLSKRPDGRPPSMDEVILRLKEIGSSVGAPLMMSGQFSLPASGAMPAGSHVAFTGTPSGGFSTGADSRQPLSASLTPAGVPSGGPRTATDTATGSTSPEAGDASATPSQAPPARVSHLATAVLAAAIAVAGSLGLPTLLDDTDLAARWTALFTQEPSTADGANDDGRSPEGASTASEASPPAHAAPTSAAVSASALDAPAQFVLVQLTSDPTGTEIRIEGLVRGTTPTQIELVGDPARYGRTVEIVFSRPGYRSTKVTRTITSDRLDIHAALSRLRRRTEPGPRPSAW